MLMCAACRGNLDYTIVTQQAIRDNIRKIHQYFFSGGLPLKEFEELLLAVTQDFGAMVWSNIDKKIYAFKADVKISSTPLGDEAWRKLSDENFNDPLDRIKKQFLIKRTEIAKRQAARLEAFFTQYEQDPHSCLPYLTQNTNWEVCEKSIHANLPTLGRPSANPTSTSSSTIDPQPLTFEERRVEGPRLNVTIRRPTARSVTPQPHPSTSFSTTTLPLITPLPDLSQLPPLAASTRTTDMAFNDAEFRQHPRRQYRRHHL